MPQPVDRFVTFGAIPTTMPVAPLLTAPFQAANRDVHVELFSLSADQILRQLDTFELDLGLTYLEDPNLKGYRVLPLYRERHVLLARDPGDMETRKNLGWTDAAELPLCLLTPNMQNRRLIGGAFRDADVTPRVLVETDSVFALYAHVRCAGLFGVVPHSLLCLFEMRQEVTAIPLCPELSRQIGLIAPKHEPVPPVRAAAWSAAEQLDLQSRFDALISDIYCSIDSND